MQILHPTRESEVRPRHQAQTPQKKADTQNRPMRTTHLAPRYHPIIKQAVNAHNITCTTLGLVREQSINACQNKSSKTRTAHPDEHKHSGETHQQILGRDATK